MMRKFILVIVFLFSTWAIAQEAEMPEFKTYALLIAVSEYDYNSDLVNPVPDATAIEKELREAYQCETALLQDPTRSEFIAAMQAVAGQQYSPDERLLISDRPEFSDMLDKLSGWKYGPNDQLLIFFAGHGWFDEKTKCGYFILKDSKELGTDPLYDSFILHTQICTIVERLDCNHVLLILDSCFSGTLDRDIAMARKTDMGRALTDPYKSVTRSEFIRRKLEYKTRLCVTSGGKEYVPDGLPGHHSPFAYSILESLRTYGGNDGILTLEEMMIELEKVVPQPRIRPLQGNEPGGSFVLVAGDALPPSPTPITPITPPDYGELIISVKPEDAKVTVTAGPLGDTSRGMKAVRTKGNRFRVVVGQKYSIQATRKDYKPLTREILVKEKEQAVDLKLAPRVVPRVLRSFVPGWEQYHKGRYVSGTIFASSAFLAGIGAYVCYSQYDKSVDDYNIASKRHLNAISPADISETEQAMIKAHDDADKKFQFRQIAYIVLGDIWALNMLHALIVGPAKTSSPQQAKLPDWDFAPHITQNVIGVSVCYRF